MVAHNFDFNTREAETGRFFEFEVSLFYQASSRAVSICKLLSSFVVKTLVILTPSCHIDMAIGVLKYCNSS